jgi:hypothetical protein
MATGPRHGEATTTRPALQHGVARVSRHANQVRLWIGSLHAKARQIANVLAGFSTWLDHVLKSAEQLTELERWRRLLRRIFTDFAGINLDPYGPLPLPEPSNCRI